MAEDIVDLHGNVASCRAVILRCRVPERDCRERVYGGEGDSVLCSRMNLETPQECTMIRAGRVATEAWPVANASSRNVVIARNKADLDCAFRGGLEFSPSVAVARDCDIKIVQKARINERLSRNVEQRCEYVCQVTRKVR